MHKKSDLSGFANLVNLNQGVNDNNSNGGLNIRLLGVTSYEELEKVAYNFQKAMNEMPEITHEKSLFNRVEVYDLSLNRDLAGKLDVPINNIYTSIKYLFI